MVALPLLVLASGVNVAVVLKYVFPSVSVNELMAEMGVRLPPKTVISESMKVVPGSSEKVNVMVGFWPASILFVPLLLVIVTVGGRVS